MQANPKTIDKLFDGQTRYVVPMFQRLYVWGEDPQWRTLWEDVVEKAELRIEGKTANPHYLGALIIEGVRPVTGREVTRLLVIDGQQRLTTLQILLCAFRDLAKANGWQNLERRAHRYLENPDADVMEKPDEEIYKLWPTLLNRKVFSDIISAGDREIVEEKYPLIRKKYARKPEPRSPLVEGYLFFFDRIEEWIVSAAEVSSKSDEDCAFALLQALQQDFRVVEIALSDGDDSQEIFYSLNSQGRPLSQSDLLRSLIFMRAEKEREDRDALFDDFWGAFETPFWSFEVKRGGRTYSRLDLALRHFLTVKTGTLIDARRVNEEYRRWIASSPQPYPNVRSELTDFTLYAQAFEQMESSLGPKRSTETGRVLRDFDVSTATPLVLFLQLEAELSDEALKNSLDVVQSFVVRRAITGEENKEYNKMFVEVVAALRGLSGSDVQPALEKKLLSGGGTTRIWPSDEQVIEEALTSPIYGRLKQPALRVILERLELSLRTKKSEDDLITAGLQIEHVLPVSWATHWPIEGQQVTPYQVMYPFTLGDDQEDLRESIRARAAHVNTLGNLTLLNEYLNPAASNGNFDLKKEEYRHSVLALNRYFSAKKSWNEAAIRERGQAMAGAICKLWPKPQS